MNKKFGIWAVLLTVATFYFLLRVEHYSPVKSLACALGVLVILILVGINPTPNLPVPGPSPQAMPLDGPASILGTRVVAPDVLMLGIRALHYHEGDFCVLQCLEYDISARGSNPEEAEINFATRFAELFLDDSSKSAPELHSIQRADKKFWDMFVAGVKAGTPARSTSMRVSSMNGVKAVVWLNQRVSVDESAPEPSRVN